MVPQGFVKVVADDLRHPPAIAVFADSRRCYILVWVVAVHPNRKLGGLNIKPHFVFLSTSMARTMQLVAARSQCPGSSQSSARHSHAGSAER
ncbi:MAG: hypothetical protein ABIS17_09200, partial [Casimicrobiaceae bacterium]